MPSKDSFAVGECILLHDTIQEEIYVFNDTLLPFFVRDGILSVLLMVYHLIPYIELTEYQYLIE